MAKRKQLEAFLEASKAFGERKLWERFTNFDCIGLRLGVDRSPMLASIMGNAGEQFGLMLIRGDDPAESLESMLQPKGPGSDGIEAMDMMSLNLDPFGSLDEGTQDWFRQNGQHPKVADIVPWPMVKGVHKHPNLPTEDDLDLLTWVVRAIVKADLATPLTPAELDDPEGIPFITMVDKSSDPETTREPWRRSETTPKPIQNVNVPLGSDLEHSDATYLVGMTPMPTSIDENDRSLQLLLMVDGADGKPVQCKPVYSGDVQEAVDAMLDSFNGRTIYSPQASLPREIIFTSRALHDAVKSSLTSAGVTCHYEPSIPPLDAMGASLIEVLVENPPSAFGLEDDSDDTIPAADDLSAWKQANRHLVRRFADFFYNEDQLWSSRAMNRYLGHTDLISVLDEFEQLGAAEAYCAWGVVDYRPTRKSKTHAEKMIKQGLPAAQELLLRARLATPPSLHRVEGLDPEAGTVEMEDILLGGTRTVHDQLFAENTDCGIVFIGRVYPAGAFHFMEQTGPPLGSLMANGAIDALREDRLVFTPKGLLAEAHKLGRLWEWIEDYRDTPPVLCNTDGDLLVPHTASFTVSDEGGARKALMARDDVDHNEEADEYIWQLADAPGAKTIVGPVLMAQMRFLGDELVVNINSEQRMSRVREWLEKIPGVRFLRAESKPLDIPEHQRPMDDRLGFDEEPMDFPPEMVQYLEQHFHQYYMDWLDTSLPALHGETPREACRTKDGREKVAILIRTIPDPVGNGGASVPIPRQAMLRELGLESDPEISDDAPALPGPIHAPEKIGRNAPCPCGSGKKYKKCCGR